MASVEILQRHPLYLLWCWLALINIAAFIIMGVDKYKAVHKKWRIPERTLFIFVILGGSLGGICGMYAFRHKTLHKKFVFGFPAILIVQIVLGILIHLYI